MTSTHRRPAVFRFALFAAAPLALGSFAAVYVALSFAAAVDPAPVEAVAVVTRSSGDTSSKVGHDRVGEGEGEAPEVDREPAVAPEPAAEEPAGPGHGAPAHPADRDIARVASSMRRASARCADGAVFAGDLYVMFLGSGRVGTVEVRGGDPAIGRCVERQAFALTVPAFTDSSFVAHVRLTTTPPHPEASTIANLPDPDELDRAFARARRALARCAAGQGGEVQLAATIAGVNGRPTTVVVLPPFGGTEQGACMERAVVSHVHVPPFESRSYTMTTRLSL